MNGLPNWIVHSSRCPVEVETSYRWGFHMLTIDGDPVDAQTKEKLHEWLDASMQERTLVIHLPGGSAKVMVMNVEDATLVKLRWGTDMAPIAG